MFRGTDTLRTYAISSTGRDQPSLCDTPMSVSPSVNHSCYLIPSEAIYHRDFFIVPVCQPYGVVVHLRLL